MMRRRAGRLAHPAHEPFRDFCRIAGPVLIVAGFIMTAIGVYDFSAGFGDFDRGPGLFWLCFVGMLVLGGGVTLARIGYLGAAARYVAAETAPVATDAFNYVARGASEGVKQIAGAVADGMRRDTGGKVVVRCHKCEAENDADAKFCKACGAALGKSVACPACNERNDPDANFCDNCGGKLG
jgi:ribosomal protein L40E